MDEGNGYSLSPGCAKIPVTAAIPVILMTGNGIQKACGGPWDLGADRLTGKAFHARGTPGGRDARSRNQKAQREHEEQTRASGGHTGGHHGSGGNSLTPRPEISCDLNRAGRAMSAIPAVGEDVRSVPIQSSPAGAFGDYLRQGIPAAISNGVLDRGNGVP